MNKDTVKTGGIILLIWLLFKGIANGNPTTIGPDILGADPKPGKMAYWDEENVPFYYVYTAPDPNTKLQATDPKTGQPLQMAIGTQIGRVLKQIEIKPGYYWVQIQPRFVTTLNGQKTEQWFIYQTLTRNPNTIIIK